MTNSTNPSNGTGVFDVLIKAVEIHIQEQYAQLRITSDDFAVVYLGAIQSTMAESLKFILAEQAAGLEADLLAEKIKSEIKNNEVGGLIDLQKADAEASTAGKLQQTLTEVENTLLAKEKTESEILANKDDGVIAQQTKKLINENLVLQERVLSEKAQTAKTDAEKNLLNEKTFTEEAQTKDIVNGIPVSGIVGEKKKLFTAQTDGFQRDAEQKILKIMVDSFNVAKNADPTGVSGNNSNNLSDSDIGAVVAKAKSGIGV